MNRLLNGVVIRHSEPVSSLSIPAAMSRVVDNIWLRPINYLLPGTLLNSQKGAPGDCVPQGAQHFITVDEEGLRPVRDLISSTGSWLRADRMTIVLTFSDPGVIAFVSSSYELRRLPVAEITNQGLTTFNDPVSQHYLDLTTVPFPVWSVRRSLDFHTMVMALTFDAKQLNLEQLMLGLNDWEFYFNIQHTVDDVPTPPTLDKAEIIIDGKITYFGKSDPELPRTWSSIGDAVSGIPGIASNLLPPTLSTILDKWSIPFVFAFRYDRYALGDIFLVVKLPSAKATSGDRQRYCFNYIPTRRVLRNKRAGNMTVYPELRSANQADVAGVTLAADGVIALSIPGITNQWGILITGGLSGNGTYTTKHPDVRWGHSEAPHFGVAVENLDLLPYVDATLAPQDEAICSNNVFPTSSGQAICIVRTLSFVKDPVYAIRINPDQTAFLDPSLELWLPAKT